MATSMLCAVYRIGAREFVAESERLSDLIHGFWADEQGRRSPVHGVFWVQPSAIQYATRTEDLAKMQRLFAESDRMPDKVPAIGG